MRADISTKMRILSSGCLNFISKYGVQEVNAIPHPTTLAIQARL
jgi:hypothetical protein